jgi:hypothetical protein
MSKPPFSEKISANSIGQKAKLAFDEIFSN